MSKEEKKLSEHYDTTEFGKRGLEDDLLGQELDEPEVCPHDHHLASGIWYCIIEIEGKKTLPVCEKRN